MVAIYCTFKISSDVFMVKNVYHLKCDLSSKRANYTFVHAFKKNLLYFHLIYILKIINKSVDMLK